MCTAFYIVSVQMKIFPLSGTNFDTALWIADYPTFKELVKRVGLRKVMNKSLRKVILRVTQSQKSCYGGLKTKINYFWYQCVILE